MRHTKYLGFFIIIILGLACLIKNAKAANPESKVTQFIKAIQEKDFKSIFELTFDYQNGVSEIRANKPKVLWEKLISEYYESQKDMAFKEEEISLLLTAEMKAAEYIKTLMGFFSFPNKWKIIETRGNEVYVSVNYHKVEESPLLDFKFLKEIILDFYMSESGLYMWSKRVAEGDVYWEKAPLRILSVRWHGDQIGGIFIEIIGIGGSPLYDSITRCGNCMIENLGRPDKLGENTILIYIDRDQYKRFKNCIEESGELFPLLFSVTLSDRSGQQDSTVFEVPEVFGGYCWVANPWHQRGQARPKFCSSPLELRPISELEKEIEKVINIPIEIINMPSDLRILKYSPATIAVIIRAPKRIARVVTAANVFARSNLEDAKIEQEEFPIEIKVPSGVDIINKSENKVNITLEKSQEIMLDIRPIIIGKIKEGLRIEKIEVIPPKVKVWGSKSKIKGNEGVSTSAIDISSLTESAEFQVDLYPFSPDVRLERLKTKVIVKIIIKKIISKN